MISINDILTTNKIKKNLGTKGIKLSEIKYDNLNNILKKYNIKLGNYSLRQWNEFKKSKKYNRFLEHIYELYDLGYGSKFISLCLSIKYNKFTSHTMIHKKINKKVKDRMSYTINNEIFKKSDIIIKSRIAYSKNADSSYLSFKCSNIREISKDNRTGIRIFFNKEYDKIFLERDDRSVKKITVHPEGGLFISLYPLPNELKEFLKDTKTTYKSIPIKTYFNSKNFGFKREELIDDTNARTLYPELKKFGFNLLKNRTTNMSRSKGDLIIFKNNKKLIIEITNVAKNKNTTNKYSRDHNCRDKLIGKIIRLITINKNEEILFIFNEVINKSVINEDFKKIIKKYKIKIIFTDFKKNWEIKTAKKINNLFKSK